MTGFHNFFAVEGGGPDLEFQEEDALITGFNPSAGRVRGLRFARLDSP